MDGYLTTNGKRFFLRSGLAGQANSVSFESVDFPGYYFRHISTRLELEDREGGRNGHIYDEDATYIMLRDKWYSGYVVFQSVNYPTWYLRHRGFQLWVEDFTDTDLYKRDSSWRMSEGKYCKRIEA